MPPRPMFAIAAAVASLAAGCDPAPEAAAQRAPSASSMSSTASELDAFEQRVRDYLLEHPEVIMEALQVLQERQRAAEAEQLRGTIEAHREELLNDPASPVGGNPEGDVTLVEFFDYNCAYCRSVAPIVAEIERTDPALRLVFREFPILGEGSEFAARAALAARKQGKYASLHHALMQAKERLTEEQVLETARSVGLDTERLQADMADPAIRAAIERNLALAGALGITGTPSFLIGNTLVPGAVDLGTLQGLVARARQADAAPSRPSGG
jgi:protein-disulfide isomerase